MSDGVRGLMMVRGRALRDGNQMLGAAMAERLKRFLLPDQT
jgi:hypothetical protein